MRFGTWVLVTLQGAAARCVAMYALELAAAGCHCQMWLPVSLQGAAGMLPG